jgi:two-component system phosphate regulon sensor histidine kinase PhoR
VLKIAITKYLVVSFISFAVTYSMYHLTVFTIGHSLLLFAFLQFISFVMFLLQFNKNKNKGIEHLQQMVTGFTQDDFKEYPHYEVDMGVYDLSRKIKELRQRYQEEILTYKQAQDRFFHILQNIKSAVILLDKNSNIQFLNAAGEELFQVSRIDVMTKPHWKLGRESGLSSKIDEVRKTGEVVTTEIKLSYPFPRVMETTISPTTINDKGFQETVILMHDVTERGIMDQMRKEFVANVSHELKTPLTSIKGFTETLLDGALDNRNVSERFLTIIYKEADRLEEMVNSLLDLSVIESKGIQKNEVNMVQLIEQAVEQMSYVANKKDILFSFSYSSPGITMLGDENRLKQIIINLLSNSINYSKENKKILVNLVEKDREIHLTIKDQGIGIPAEHMDRIFERFYRVDSSRNQKSGGRGIGLSIVKQIVKQHGGHIQIKSTVNVGTTIAIIFPSKENHNHV